MMQKIPQVDASLRSIAQKIAEERRLTLEEGLILFETPYQEDLFALADFVRKRKVGDRIRYTSTLHLYPTNICDTGCSFCSFHACANTGYFYTPEMLEEKLVQALPLGISEVHIVGGLYKKCDLFYYQNLFRRIRRRAPNILIKALTAVEIDFLARLHKMEYRDVLSCLINEGLSFLPGGGAEILDPEIRNIIAPKKCSSEKYLAIHKTAHSLGLSSNITMLFNHIEEEKHIVSHLEYVRRLQDETGRVQTFIPLPYLTQNKMLCSRPIKKKKNKTVFAVSRLMLDNVDHIKVLWNYLGINEAKELLWCGADDLGSTSIEEKVARSANGEREVMKEEDLEATIKKMGRTPSRLYSGEMV